MQNKDMSHFILRFKLTPPWTKDGMRPYFVILSAANYAEDIRDVKPPVDFPPSFFFLYFLLAIVALAAVIGLFYFLKTRFKKPRPMITPPPKPPHETAYERLQELKEQNLPSQGRFKEYYTILADIIRRYIEDRFGIRAPEMTTQEFLDSLRASEELTPEHKNLLKGFLNSCDMVKFAKYGPTFPETEESFQHASKFIDETKIMADLNCEPVSTSAHNESRATEGERRTI